MLFGHNTNVKAGDTTYHVQTEDRGTANALIDTTVYCQGRVLHRRTNNYFDLLPLNADSEVALKLRLNEQHRIVLEEIRSGLLRLAPPPSRTESKPATAVESNPTSVAPTAASPRAVAIPSQQILSIELVNAKRWLSGKRASLQIAVRDRALNAVEGARVTAKVDGAADLLAVSEETAASGLALLEFDMPRLSGSEPALVIEAAHGAAKGQLRFQLRSKSRVPSASSS